MKKGILVFCFSVFTFHYSFSQGVWTWMGGDTALNGSGVYGTQGVPSVNNHPPAVYSPYCWTDLQGNFWLYGGLSDDSVAIFSDLWRFNPTTLEWTWEKGNGKFNRLPRYGKKGVGAPANTPGSRTWTGCTWVDKSGDLWLFSGEALGPGYDDMWKYNISSNEWISLSDSSLFPYDAIYGVKGIPSPLNNPGLRAEIGSPWVDSNGKFWLYGGQDNDRAVALSDMWMYDPITNMWTWESGLQGEANDTPSYNEKGVFATTNTPGIREPYAMIINNEGNFLVFGGEANMNGCYGDLWEYNPAINQWAWLNGNKKVNSTAVGGVSCQSDSTFYPDARYENRAAWKDCAGNFWMYGGMNNNIADVVIFGDVWVYLSVKKEWAKMSASSYKNTNPVFGKPGVPAFSNQPGAIYGQAHWQDKKGNFWVMGGSSYYGSYNDMWRYTPDYNCINVNCGCTAYGGTIVSSSDSICFGSSNLFSVIGNMGSLQWQTSTDGVHFTDIPNDTLNTYATPLLTQTTYYRLIAESGSCGTDTSNTVTVQVVPAPSANFTYTANGTQFGFQPDSVLGGVISYKWDFGDGKTSAEINPVHTFDSVKTYFVCLTVYNGSNCSFTRCQYVSAPNGVQNISSTHFIRLYPNPANNELTVEVLNGNAPKQISITDDLGRTLIQLNTYKTKTQVDIHALAAGIYFVKTQLADGRVEVRKLVKE